MEPLIYKKWHIIKLVPSAVEGLLLTAIIKIKTDNYFSENRYLPGTIENLILGSEKIFIDLLNLTVKSDLDEAEIMRIQAYNQLIKAEEEFSKIKK